MKNREHLERAKEYLSDFLLETGDCECTPEEISEAFDEVIAELVKYFEDKAETYRAVARRRVSKA